MDALIRYFADPFRGDDAAEIHVVSGGTVLDTVRGALPSLDRVPLVLFRNGRRLQGDELIAPGDEIEVAVVPQMYAAPVGFWQTLWNIAAQAIIAAAVGAVINHLLRPKERKNKAASPAYSVAIDQNAARLGGTIPVIYGRVLAMPDIAAQPYAEFLQHQERVSMILCLGMGEFDIHDVFLGESRVSEFPPGSVETWVFKPGDHGRALGNIERITGVVEDMLTIPEASGVDLAAPNDPAEVTVAATVSGGTLFPIDGGQAQLWVGLVPGRQYTVSNSAGGSAIVRYVGQGPNNSAVFDGPLPAPPAPTWIDTPLQLTPIDDAQEGAGMYLYTQRSIGALAVDEIVYVDDWPFTTRLGPFQVAYKNGDYRAFLRTSGLGFTSATGNQGFYPMRNGAVVRNAYVTYSVAEYIPGVADDDLRWRGWYSSSRPGVNVDTVYVDITMPNGIAWITDKGDYKSITTSFYVDIQQIDDAGNPIGGLWRNTVKIAGATSTARRVSFKFVIPWGPLRCRIRVARVNARDQRASKEISAASLASIRTRIYHPAGAPAYEDATLLVMRFVASAALNAASNRRIKVDCTRKLDDYVAGFGPTTSPAAACRDAYRNTTYGGGRPDSEFDSANYWRLNPQWMTTGGFNGVFDQPITLMEALQQILTPVRAMPLPVGKIMSVAQDAPRGRDFVFGPESIVTSTLQVVYGFDGPDPVDCIEVIYTDPKTFTDARAFYPSEGVRPETVELMGCTSASHAASWARLAWQERILNRKVCEFELEGEGYLLDPLVRYGLVVPVLDYGSGGRVTYYDPVSRLIEIDTPWPPEASYIRFKGPDGKLTAPVARTAVESPYLFKLASDPPVTVKESDSAGEGTQWIAARGALEVYDFRVSNLETSGAFRVKVSGQQYSDAAYTGTFLQNWSP